MNRGFVDSTVTVWQRVSASVCVHSADANAQCANAHEQRRC